jgi:Outer membrane lipoprotein-sorting protein
MTHYLIGILLMLSHVTWALSPQEILKKVDENRAPAATFTTTITVTSKKPDSTSTAELVVRVKDAKKSLVLYNSPLSSKGRVLLMIDDNLWIYIPGTQNPIRISPQQQLMGQVSNADVARVVYSLDYTADSVVPYRLNNQERF